MSKDQVAKGTKALFEALAKQTWPNIVARDAAAIERAIPPDTQNEYAIEARENAQLARKYGEVTKGWLHLRYAEVAFKDYQLLDDATKHDASKNGTNIARKNRTFRTAVTRQGWHNAAIVILAGRTRKPGQRELARLVAKQLNPLLADEEIDKLADSRRNWIKDLL